MRRITLKDIVMVIQRTLDSMDDRLIGHGEKVAYIMYKLLKCHGGYSDEYDLLEKIDDDTYLSELYGIFEKRELSRRKIILYLRMLNYAIDFRSESTILHTINVQEISWRISKMIGLDDIRNIATLHHEKLNGSGYPFGLSNIIKYQRKQE